MKQRIIRAMIGAIIGSLLITMALNTFAQKIPDPVGYVNDYADVLTNGEEKTLEAILKDYEEKSTIEITIVTITSLDGENIDDYTLQLARKWGVGKKDKNNGIVILNSIGDKKWRIVFGYGIKEFTSDEYFKYIGDNHLTPNLKNGMYFDAYRETVVKIMERFGNLTVEDKERMAEEDSGYNILFWGLFILFMIVLFGFFGNLSKKTPEVEL